MNDVPQRKPLGHLSRTQQRTIVAIAGIVLMCLAALPQLPYINWSLTNGVSHGFDSGKSALNNSWVIIMSMIDLTVLSTWLYFRPRNAAWVLVPTIVIFVCMFIAIPLAFVLSAVVNFFMSI